MNNSVVQLDYLIIGAGPAGVQLAYYLEQSGADYLVLEAGSGAGAFFEEFPRHRTLISINKRFTGSEDLDFNMRHDWNSLLTEDLSFPFSDLDKKYFPDADNMVKYISSFADKFNLSINYNTKVVSIRAGSQGYVATSNDGRRFSAKCLIVATGFFKPFVPEIPGIEDVENYIDMSVNASEFENQRVLIIGKGNSGFETADHLVASASVLHIASPESIRMAWKNHYVGSLRAVNNNFLDTYQLKSQNAVIDADIESIKKNKSGGFVVTFAYKHAENEVESIYYDRVLCCAGFRIDDSVFDVDIAPALTIKNKYPLLTSEFESVNQKNMFFAGTLTHSLDYRKTTSGFIHGFRYNVKALARILGRKYDSASLPEEELALDHNALSKFVLGRANVSGGLWQQPGFIADYFYVNENGRVRYGKELPVSYVKDFVALSDTPLFTLTLEYGDPIEGDPFSTSRIHRENVSEARNSQFLHPIIRRYEGGECTNEHHVLEDLESRWEESVHYQPLVIFLKTFLGLEKEEACLADNHASAMS